jgi:hypothetical protein
MLKMLTGSLLFVVILLLFIVASPVSLADNTSYGMITGYILDNNGMPIANATVNVHDWTGLIIGSAITAENGSFTYSNISITGVGGFDTFKLTAIYNSTGKTYMEDTLYFRVYQNQITEQNVTIYDYPPSGYGWITGNVVNVDNNSQYLSATIYVNNGMYTFVSGVPGDNYQFYLPENTYTVYAEHDENGKTFVSGNYTVSVSSDEVNTAILTISLNNSTSVYHPPPPVGDNIVYGNVVQANGQPLYGATMDLCRVTGQSFQPEMTTTTNITGGFEFDNVTINEASDNYVVRLTYNYNGSNYVNVSNPPIAIYNNNMLNVPHVYNVNMAVNFVDSGSIQIITTPPGAEIWINSADSGVQTPFNFTGMKTGIYACSLQKDGYLPANMTVTVTSENTTNINKVLLPSTGDALFNVTPSDASIYLNGNLVGKGNINLTKLQYGQYTYKIYRDGYQNVSGNFQISPGGQVPITVNMVAVPGFSLTYFSYIINQIFGSLGNLF